MKYAIYNRWDGKVQFTAEINCQESAPDDQKKWLAVLWAQKIGASLTGARLTGARLIGASLSGADLSVANLSGANLSGADLSVANLSGANLSGARLTGAWLDGANLTGARLDGADLSGARFGATVYVTAYGPASISIPPTQILGLHWHVYIFDDHIKIGCELHTMDEWDSFDDDRIKAMDGHALAFWRGYKGMIMTAARAHRAKVQESAAEAPPNAAFSRPPEVDG